MLTDENQNCFMCNFWKLKKRKQLCTLWKPSSQSGDLKKELQSRKWVLQENYFCNRLRTSCSGFTLPWQANGVTLMVLPIKPQSLLLRKHFSLSLYGLQQTTHVTFVWVIYCLGKGSMKLLFRENHWNSLAGSIQSH